MYLGIVSPDRVWKLNKTVCFVFCSCLCGLVHGEDNEFWCKEAIIEKRCHTEALNRTIKILITKM